MIDPELHDAPTWRCPDEIVLAAFVDGGMDPHDRARLERHLADCARGRGRTTHRDWMPASEGRDSGTFTAASLLSQK